MRTVNLHFKKFQVGSKVVMTTSYMNGNVKLYAGDVGEIISAKIESFPDLGLFDIRIINIKFKNCELNMGDKVAAKIMRPL